MFKLTPAQFGLGGLATLGAAGAGFFLSKEKKKAQNKVETFKSQDIKNWDKFTDNTARKSFVQELGKDPMTDPKLLMYADNMNRLKTGSKVQDISGNGGKSYQITKLRGSNRLGCTCNDWRYKRSVAQPGEERDCKHIKQYRQMSKTAASSFKDTLPNPVIDGKPHSGTWTIVGSGRLSIPKKTSDIGVVYTSDAMKKEGGHVEDRIAERAPGTEAEVNTLRAKLDQIKLRKGQTYHVPLSRGKGYAVIGDVGNRHVVKTVLGPSMRPPGERLTNLSNYRKIEVSGKEVLLDKEIPLITKLPKDTTKLVKFLTDKTEKAKSSRWSHGQIAIPSSVNLENLPQAVKTRWAIPLPGEKVGTPTIRIGRLHAHTSDPVHVIHLDSHAPEGIKSVLKHVPEAVRAAKTLILDKPDPFVKDARAPRDYKREYAQYHAKPDQVENRSLRNQARRKLGLKKGDPREADHKTPLSKGGGNGHANLRAVSRKTNRTKFTDPS